MGKIPSYGKSKGVYMSFKQHLNNYPNKEELKIFYRAQEIGNMASESDDESNKENVRTLLVREFGSVEEAVKKFHSVTVNILKEWVPEKERTDSSFDGLLKHVTTNGVIDVRKMEAQEGRYGYNGGRGCDVQSGACSCGAWH